MIERAAAARHAALDSLFIGDQRAAEGSEVPGAASGSTRGAGL